MTTKYSKKVTYGSGMVDGTKGGILRSTQGWTDPLRDHASHQSYGHQNLRVV